MTSELAIFVSGLSTLVLAVVFAVMAYLYFKLGHKYFSLKTDKDFTKLKEGEAEEARKKAQKTYEEANVKSQKIIGEASQKAQNILSEAEIFSSQGKEKMHAFLQEITAQQAKSFQEILVKFDSNSIKLLNSISTNVQQNAGKELQVFRLSLQQEAAKFGNTLIDAVKAQRKEAEVEIQAYKQARIKNVDDKIFEIIKAASREILGKALTSDEHEDLIIKALEEAKKEEVF